MSDHLITIGKNIKFARQIKKWSQTELANESGLRIATISDIENGKLNFEINTLVRIASALNCYLDITLTPVKAK